ncbi:hypothetical protein GCM10022238_15490 [Gordonia hankookensis]
MSFAAAITSAWRVRTQKSPAAPLSASATTRCTGDRSRRAAYIGCGSAHEGPDRKTYSARSDTPIDMY